MRTIIKPMNTKSLHSLFHGFREPSLECWSSAWALMRRADPMAWHLGDAAEVMGSAIALHHHQKFPADWSTPKNI
jgi:hypothetical protein